MSEVNFFIVSILCSFLLCIVAVTGVFGMFYGAWVLFGGVGISVLIASIVLCLALSPIIIDVTQGLYRNYQRKREEKSA